MSELFGVGPKACPREFEHDHLRTEVFKHCPTCGVDLVEWQTSIDSFRKEIKEQAND